jgi:hypothetical protein
MTPSFILPERRPFPLPWKILSQAAHSELNRFIPIQHTKNKCRGKSVAAAVVFGSERPQTGTLIEVAPSLQIDVHNPVQLAELRNKIW